MPIFLFVYFIENGIGFKYENAYYFFMCLILVVLEVILNFCCVDICQ